MLTPKRREDGVVRDVYVKCRRRMLQIVQERINGTNSSPQVGEGRSLTCYLYAVFTKSKPEVLTITLKVVNTFPSNLVHNISDTCLTMRHKKCQFHLTYVCTLPCKVMRVKIENCEKIWCNFTLLLAKTRTLRRKQFSLYSNHIICLHFSYDRSL